MLIIKELEEVEVPAAAFPRRRIAVLQRDDGAFTFAEQYYYVTRWEGEVIAEGWHTQSTNGIYAGADAAESDGRATFARCYGLTY